MGRKVHPYGFRLKVIRDWKSRWYAEGHEYADLLHEDQQIRELIFSHMRARSRDGQTAVSRVEIERFPPKQVSVIIWTSRPGVVIGRKGENVKALRQDLEQLTEGKRVHVDVQEIEQPDIDAKLVAMRAGAEGIKVMCKGRLAGAEMARVIWMREGRVPLQTLRADIDYAQEEARTTYGRIGVKVWVYRGEILPSKVAAPVEEPLA